MRAIPNDTDMTLATQFWLRYDPDSHNMILWWIQYGLLLSLPTYSPFCSGNNDSTTCCFYLLSIELLKMWFYYHSDLLRDWNNLFGKFVQGICWRLLVNYAVKQPQYCFQDCYYYVQWKHKYHHRQLSKICFEIFALCKIWTLCNSRINMKMF